MQGKEKWKPIPGFESFYHVSNMGRVKSLKYKQATFLKPRPDKDGYSRATLRKNGKSFECKVHRLVLQAFKGHSNLPVDHRNEIKSDNRFSNLRYCTHRENKIFFVKKHPSKSNCVGVKWRKDRRYWIATMEVKGKCVYIGSFSNKKEAGKAYMNAIKNI